MLKKRSIYLGKTLRRIVRLRGGGSALPGLLVEKLDPDFLNSALHQLQYGVILVSGTNGKTTTTKMIAEMLDKTGYRVFTNKTGSNFTRGVASSLLESVNMDGHLPYDVAVLELDEAHAVKFAELVKPRISLFLNVMRDQLDRFGELDHTAKLLGKVAKETTESVILNRDDPMVASVAKQVKKNVKLKYFGAHENVLHLFPSDEKLRSADKKQSQTKPKKYPDEVELVGFKDQLVGFTINSKLYKTELKLSGFYNFLNAAAALATVRMLKPNNRDQDINDFLKALSLVEPAFGRGERGWYQNQPIEFALVKNPSGFQLSLASAQHQKKNEAVMIAINDNFADGRDMSWLWDVDFASLKKDKGVEMVGGVRAYDMALRLQYDEVSIGEVTPALSKAFHKFLKQNAGKPMRIYCTYTCMLELRKIAAKKLNMERAL